jgi:ABC-type transporter Mla subunit MlaD
MRGTYFRVGLLVLVGAGLLVGAVLFLGGNQIRHGRPYETYFRDSVQGLDVGAPVKYRGVTIGAVTEIALVSAVYGRNQPDIIRRSTFRTVLVRFEIDTSRVGQAPTPADIEREGLRTRIASAGLTGLSYMELDFANPERFPTLQVPWTPRYEYISSMPSTFAQVQDAATVLLGKIQQIDINGLADGIQGLVTQLRGELKDGDAHILMTQATDTLRTLQTQMAAADVPALAADLHKTLDAAQALAQGPQTKQLLASAKAATDRLTLATAKLPQLIASLDAVARRADSGSADLEAGLVPLLRDARTAVSALRQTSEALRRDPGQLILGGPPPRGSEQ